MESMSVQVHAVIKVKGGAQRIQRIDIYGNSLTSIKASTFHFDEGSQLNCKKKKKTALHLAKVKTKQFKDKSGNLKTSHTRSLPLVF